MLDPPAGQPCGPYMQEYLTQAPGQLLNVGATTGCQYCPLSSSGMVFAGSGILYSTCWRDFGILWACAVFNIFAATLLHYCFLREEGERIHSQTKVRNGSVRDGKGCQVQQRCELAK